MPYQITDEDKRIAYDEGRQAFINGVPRHKNPYTLTEKEQLDVYWNEGWDWQEMKNQADDEWTT